MTRILTPFELALRHELEGEFVRMANKWFFPWHNLNIAGRVVDVEDFYGGRFHTGGIVFQGQIQKLYWRSVQKYLVDKVHTTFQEWQGSSRDYPVDIQRTSLEGMALELRHFVARIVDHGVDVDRRLRGRGFPENVAPYNASDVHTAANATIERLETAHSGLISQGNNPETEPVEAPWKRLEAFFGSLPGTLAALGLLLALVSIVVSVFVS